MIRKATLGDLPAIWILGRRIHQKSDDRTVPMDQAKSRTFVANLIGSPQGFVMVDEVDGLVTGLVVGFVDELWWSRKKYAIPLLCYAERPGALTSMLAQFVRWAIDQKGAVQIPLDCSFGGKLGEKTVELFRKLAARAPGKHRIHLEEVGSSFVVRKDLE